MEEEFSYELLFEVLMREKNRDELQKLEEDFYEKAKSFIEKEKEILKLNFDHNSLQRIKNLENMLLEVYSRREKKIVNLALIKARTDENVFDISVMLKEEREMFNRIVEILKEYRRITLEEKKVLEENKKENVEELNERLEDNNIEETVEENNIEEDREEKNTVVVEESEEEQEKILETIKNDDFVIVQFLKPVNKFVDEELNYYGPFDEEETAKIPKKIALILVQKGEAKIIE